MLRHNEDLLNKKACDENNLNYKMGVFLSILIQKEAPACSLTTRRRVDENEGLLPRLAVGLGAPQAIIAP